MERASLRFALLCRKCWISWLNDLELPSVRSARLIEMLSGGQCFD